MAMSVLIVAILSRMALGKEHAARCELNQLPSACEATQASAVWCRHRRRRTTSPQTEAWSPAARPDRPMASVEQRPAERTVAAQADEIPAA